MAIAALCWRNRRRWRHIRARPVFVTGITTRDPDGGPMLTYGHWTDGAATLPPADLDPRLTRRIRRQAGLTVVCGAATAVLIGLRLGWP